jgi:hypothetical protein
MTIKIEHLDVLFFLPVIAWVKTDKELVLAFYNKAIVFTKQS